MGSPRDSALLWPVHQQLLLLALLGQLLPSTLITVPREVTLRHGTDLGSGLANPLEEGFLGLALIKKVQLPGDFVE